MDMANEEILTAQQAANELGVHINTLWKYLLSGKLKGFKLGGDGKSYHWRILREDFEAFKKGKRQ
jgi:excisionase family DNA binding protein